MTQQELADATGINRALISRLEKQDLMPSIPQLESLGEVLNFEPTSLFVSPQGSTFTTRSLSNEHRCSWYGLRRSLHRHFISPAQSRYRCGHSPGKGRSHQSKKIAHSGRLY
ncbi:helix-turn-helix domain-containing protein [Eubacterium aggregans]|uniref:helix-turn-helix domain-containing protein n=1 Tax=Eubacterium aggregans TaxID=81409 RepID=UPI003969DC11